MSSIPTGFTSVDLSQGGVVAYAGSVAGVEGGPVLDAAEGYMDQVIDQFNDLNAITVTATEKFFPLYRGVKAWTLDHLDLFLDVPTDTPVMTVTFYKQSVGDQEADIVSGDKIGAALTFNSATQDAYHEIAVEMANLSEQDRRFERGETLVVGFDLSSGSSLAITEVTTALLGRTRMI